MHFPNLNSERIWYRKFHPEDTPLVFQALSHPEVIRHYGVSFSSLEATQEQMDWFAQLEATETGIWWALWSADGASFYGGGGFNNLSKEYCKAEIGFWLLPEFWGRGLMQEAMPVIMRYGFEQMQLHRIEGFVESKNHNCKSAITKLGFTHEGCMRDCERKNNQWVSIDIVAMLKPDFYQ